SLLPYSKQSAKSFRLVYRTGQRIQTRLAPPGHGALIDRAVARKPSAHSLALRRPRTRYTTREFAVWGALELHAQQSVSLWFDQQRKQRVVMHREKPR